MVCRLGSLVEFPTLQFAEFPKANSAEIDRWRKIGILSPALYPHVTDIAVSLADLASFQEQSFWEFVFIFDENRHGCDFRKGSPKSAPWLRAAAAGSSKSSDWVGEVTGSRFSAT